MEKRLFGLLILIVLLGVFVQCATVSAPQGGPRDSISPVFVGSNPLPYSTNFNKKRIILSFNENVQLKDQQKLFFMSPQTDMKPLLTPKGKNLVIDFENPLETNTTYSLDFGASICDITESNPMEVFSFVFSTGDHVDTLVMNGQVTNAFSRDTMIGAFVFFYDSKNYKKDKLDSVVWNAKADAIFRTDSSGIFLADILQPKDYRVYALVDVNGNQLYEAGTDYIGFIDHDFNPLNECGFSMYYDSIKRRWNVDSLQANFEVFIEKPKKKQLLLGSSRPKQNLIKLAFNEKNAIIDTLELNGVPEQWQIYSWSQYHDSLSIWINPPTKDKLKELPDTIKAHLVYERTDSVWNMYPFSQNLNLKWKKYVPKAQKRKENQTEQSFGQKIKKLFKKKPRKLSNRHIGDSVFMRKFIADSIARDSIRAAFVADSIRQATRIKFTVNAQQTFVPINDLIFTFEAPLDTINSDGIRLWRLKKTIKKGKVVEDTRSAREAGEEIPYELFRDSIDILKWHIKSEWTAGDKYSLLIPEDAFIDILGERNDTLNSDFIVAVPEKYGSVIVKPTSQPSSITENTRYIYQIIKYQWNKNNGSEASPVVRYVKDVKPSEVLRIDYIEPGENFRLRIIEDRNGNGFWDTGVLESHQLPEKVRFWKQKGTMNPSLVVKENWTVELEVDYENLFK